LIFPCADEIDAYLKDKNDTEKDATAFRCLNMVKEINDDFWVLKNVTHLLLDLDTSAHNFDGENKDNKWIRLGIDFGKTLLYHKDCMQEFEKNPLECRCPALYGKILLLKLKNAEDTEAAQALFDELKQLEWNGEKRQLKAGEAIGWTDINQTPQIWFDDLPTPPVWGEERRKDLPIWSALEDNFQMIKNEVEKAMEIPDAVDEAYRFLFQGGNWTQILLFHDRKYTEQCEKFMPKTCEMLKKVLPDREVHHYPWTSNQNEQALILKMTPGTDVETHCGPANNILNVHLGISGVEGAKLIVAGEEYEWQEGKVITWDGSYHHTAHCKECKKDRIIMMVRYMHPDITKEHYRGNEKTHYEPVPQEWFSEKKAEL
jgi:hypothetical protein